MSLLEWDSVSFPWNENYGSNTTAQLFFMVAYRPFTSKIRWTKIPTVIQKTTRGHRQELTGTYLTSVEKGSFLSMDVGRDPRLTGNRRRNRQAAHVKKKSSTWI